MKVVTNDTVVEVGKNYLVKCARIKDSYDPTDPGIWIPVLGMPHRDDDIGTDFVHFHIDGRFTDSVAGIEVIEGICNNVLPVDLSHAQKRWIKCVDKVSYKKMKCLRLTSGIHVSREWKSYFRWYKQFIGKKCEGKRCPHMGTLMQERNGRIVCPLHGITADATLTVINIKTRYDYNK